MAALRESGSPFRQGQNDANRRDLPEQAQGVFREHLRTWPQQSARHDHGEVRGEGNVKFNEIEYY